MIDSTIAKLLGSISLPTLRIVEYAIGEPIPEGSAPAVVRVLDLTGSGGAINRYPRPRAPVIDGEPSAQGEGA